jgi:hypothetical protein
MRACASTDPNWSRTWILSNQTAQRHGAGASVGVMRGRGRGRPNLGACVQASPHLLGLSPHIRRHPRHVPFHPCQQLHRSRLEQDCLLASPSASSGSATLAYSTLFRKSQLFLSKAAFTLKCTKLPTNALPCNCIDPHHPTKGRERKDAHLIAPLLLAARLSTPLHLLLTI